jgi:cyclic pyranopterin phosphate synthase
VEPLKAAGIDAINISLDTLDEARFERLTGKNHLHRVLAGIVAAREAKFSRLKLNAVLQRSINADQLVELVLFAQQNQCVIRFIELMPLGEAAGLFPRDFLSADQALYLLKKQLTYVGAYGRQGTAFYHTFSNNGSRIRVGFITAISEPFCGACNRLRLDARGRLFPCLRSEEGVDLWSALKQGQQAFEQTVLKTLRGKKHLALEEEGEAAWPRRSMAVIGG